MRVLGGAAADILIRGDRIADVGARLDAAGAQVLDGDGLVALPGLVDLHTHLREPGREDAETVESGTRAAALGGFTAVHAMANTEPVADTAGVVEQVWRLGREAGHCDVRPVGAVTVGLAGERLAELGAMADSAARVRVFSDDGNCVSDALLMRRALEYVKAFDGVIAQHAQEPRLTAAAQMNEGVVSARLGLAGWPAVAEEAIIARDVLLAGHVGSRLHVCHVSTAGSVEILRWAKSKGWRVTAEVTPHHLLLTDELRRHLRPGVQGQPAAADGRRRRGCARRARRRDDRLSWPPIMPRTRWRTRRPSGPPPGPGCWAWRRRCRSSWPRWSSPAGSPGRQLARPDVDDAGADRRRAPTRAGRSRRVAPATLTLVDPGAPAGRWIRASRPAAAATRPSPAAGCRRGSRRRSCAAGRPSSMGRSHECCRCRLS